MKNRLIYILPFLLAVMLGSCESGNDPFDAGNHRFPWQKKSPKMYTVSLSLAGDFITESDEPLTREDDKYTYVGINVFSKGENEADSEYQNYAYGLFRYDNEKFNPEETGITIKLLSEYVYKFHATILKDDVDVLALSKVNPEKPGYAEPFRVDPSGGEYSENNINGDFLYVSDPNIDPQGQFTILSSGNAFVKIYGLTGTQSKKNSGFPRVKRFYGEYAGFNPVPNPSLTIDMAYTCFGLKFEVEEEGMPEGTYLTVEDNNWNIQDGLKFFPTDGKILFFPESLKLGLPPDGEDSGLSQSWSGIYSMNKLSHGSHDSFTLKFTWHRGSGAKEEFTHTVQQVEAGKMKVLKIKISGSTVTNPEGMISFTMGSEEMTEDTEIDSIVKDYN